MSARISDKKKVGKTHLITVSPWVILHPDILVGVLSALFKRGHMLPMLPVLSPEVVGVDATANNGGDDGAAACYFDLWDSDVVVGAYKMDSLSQRPVVIELATRTRNRQKFWVRVRTTGGSGMVLDSCALAVECIVHDPGGLGLGAVQPALDSRADWRRTQMLRGTLRQTRNDALREHGGRVSEMLERECGSVEVGRLKA